MEEMRAKVADAIERAGQRWCNEHPLERWEDVPVEVIASAAMEAMGYPGDGAK